MLYGTQKAQLRELYRRQVFNIVSMFILLLFTLPFVLGHTHDKKFKNKIIQEEKWKERNYW